VNLLVNIQTVVVDATFKQLRSTLTIMANEINIWEYTGCWVGAWIVVTLLSVAIALFNERYRKKLVKENEAAKHLPR